MTIETETETAIGKETGNGNHTINRHQCDDTTYHKALHPLLHLHLPFPLLPFLHPPRYLHPGPEQKNHLWHSLDAH